MVGKLASSFLGGVSETRGRADYRESRINMRSPRVRPLSWAVAVEVVSVV